MASTGPGAGDYTGTAFGYQWKPSGDIVANCHKQPATQFEKKLLDSSQILDSFSAFYRQLRHHNPSIKLILTVSPVRHLKDTLPLNSVSKAVLRLV
ncbi:MAG: GSCFA domain-containing protein [Desulfobacteraceae bacterium]|nr:GSCFA domain-containing protein [Desulfobacteraceae bacterium]